MRSEKFDGWRVDSWETDFGPMAFGPGDLCVEIDRKTCDLLVSGCDDRTAGFLVPHIVLNTLLARHADLVGAPDAQRVTLAEFRAALERQLRAHGLCDTSQFARGGVAEAVTERGLDAVAANLAQLLGVRR